MIKIIKVATDELATECDRLYEQLTEYESSFDNSINEKVQFNGYHKKYIESKKHLILVAAIQDKVVGYLFGYIQELELYKYPIGFLDSLFVIEEYRNHNIGTELMTHFEKWIKEKDIKYIDLKVLSNNEDAVRLYQKLNYKIRVDLMRKNLT